MVVYSCECNFYCLYLGTDLTTTEGSCILMFSSNVTSFHEFEWKDCFAENARSGLGEW